MNLKDFIFYINQNSQNYNNYKIINIIIDPYAFD
jgi:hypothetical protein